MEDKHAHFGLSIKNARLDCGMTQEALAERAGISCRYLIAIENEGRIPRLSKTILKKVLTWMSYSKERTKKLTANPLSQPSSNYPVS